MRKIFIIPLLLAFCGPSHDYENRRSKKNEIDGLKKELLKLQGLANQLSDLVMSDFSSCPNSGETADALIRKICQVAQAATVETRVEMKGEVSSLSNAIQTKLDASNDQIADIQTSHNDVLADILDIQADLTALESRMDDAEDAVDALEASVASISGTLNGTMQSIDIGEENYSAGPVFETILRRSDKTRINAFVSAASSWASLSGNPLTSTNGSSTVTVNKPTSTVTISNASPAAVTWTAHGWEDGDPVMFSTTGSLPTGLSINTVYYVRNKTANSFNLSSTPSGSLINTTSAGSGTHTSSLGAVAGDLIELNQVSGGNGFGKGHVTGEFVIVTGITASFTVVVSRTATSTGSFGSSGGLLRRVQGRGLATVWKTADGADSSVRQTSLGTKTYNFRVKASGDVCYSTTNNAASFATIDAEGVGIVCK